MILKYDFTSITHILTCILFIKADLIDDSFSLLYSKNIKCNHNKLLNLDVSDTFIYFYDFPNNQTVVNKISTAAEIIQNSLNIDYTRHLIVFVPGYKGYIKRDIEESVRQTFKEVSDIYLIIIDHSAYTYEDDEKIESYSRSVLYSYYIGAVLGGFLAEFGYPGDKIHCVGHSLGSHIIGYAGKVYMNVTRTKFWRATGLDPAGPCFTNTPEEQLKSGVAKYVEVYHCNAGHLGTTQVLADTNIFFNYKGKIQPNCDKGKDLGETAKCYHKACVHYWLDTVQTPDLYIAKSCTSYESFADGFCENNESCVIGYHNPGKARGNFYVSTEINTL